MRRAGVCRVKAAAAARVETAGSAPCPCHLSSHSSSALVFQCSHVGAEDDADMGTITATISTTISAVSTLQLSFCGRAGVDIAAALDTMGDKGLCIM